MYSKIRRFDSDVHIYETSKDEFVDVELGKYKKLEQLSQINKEGKIVAAKINGGFFNSKQKIEHLGTYIDEGLYYTDPNNMFIDFIYYKDGTTEIKHIKDLNEVAALQLKTHWVIGTSWSLVQKGKINLQNAEKILHSSWRNPRTLLGQRKDGTFVLVVVDGRNKESKGVTAKQSAEIMKELGCWNAVNLDGGGSSEMIVNNAIVNKPSDGKERHIGSAILVYKEGGFSMFNVIKDMTLSKNFKLSEFVCKEGKNEVYVDMKLIEKLQILREKIGKPITIISGYRSPSYNNRVGGSPKSQHMLGTAADIKKVDGISDEEFKKVALDIGFTGIGLYDTFWHVDVRDNPHSRGYSFWDMRK